MAHDTNAQYFYVESSCALRVRLGAGMPGSDSATMALEFGRSAPARRRRDARPSTFDYGPPPAPAARHIPRGPLPSCTKSAIFFFKIRGLQQVGSSAGGFSSVAALNAE